MNYIYRVFAAVLFLTLSHSIIAQTGSVRGLVTDSVGHPIAYTNIILDGTSLGTVTDDKGTFLIKSIRPGNYTLLASFVGYDVINRPVTIEPGKQTNLEIRLSTRAEYLEDIIITAKTNNPNERFVPSVSRLPVKLKYQTQAITVLDNKLLYDQQLINLDEAINYAPGFNLESTRGNQFPKIQIRGSSATLLINGLRLESDTRSGDGNVDFNAVENIQFINGSSSIGLGNASIGGAVNIITKSATFENSGRAFLSAGSFGRSYMGFDKQFTTKNEKLGLRLNGSWNRGETFREGVDYQYFTMAPSLAYRLTDKDKISVDYIFRSDERSQDVGQLRVDSALLATEGITIPNSFRPSQRQSIRNDYIGFEDDFQRQLENTLFVNYTREINSKLQFQVTGGLYDKDRTSRGINTRGAYADTNRDRITDSFIRSSVFQETGAVSKTIRADLTGRDIQTGPVRHNFQVSADLYSNQNFVRGNGSQSRNPGPAIDTINILNPVFMSDVNGLSPTARNAYYAKLLNTENGRERNINGITIQDQIEFSNRLRVTLGGRYTWGQTTELLTSNLGTDSVATAVSDELSYDGFSPSIGVFYDLTRNIIAYGSYSSTFDETSISPDRVDINGDIIGSEVFDQVEFGLRSSFFDNRFGANLVFYNIFNNNIAQLATDIDGEPLTSPGAVTPTNPNGEYYVLVERQTRRGVELSLQGKIANGLNVYGTYAYYQFSQQANEDQPAVVLSTDYNPTHSASLITNYEFQRGILDNFRIGGGLVYTGERTVTARGRNGFTFVNEAFTTFTITAGYRYKQFELDAKFNNVTNQLNYNFFGTTFINPISPFNFDFRLTYNF